MKYEEFEKALETLGIVIGFNAAELKLKYQKLSKKYHPDMPEGSNEKFREINEAYKLLQKYIHDFRFQIDEDSFYKQNPYSKKTKDWFYEFR